MLRGGLASHDAMTQSCGRPDMVLRGVVDREVAESTGLMAKQFGNRVIGEYPWGDLLECAKGRERPQHAREGEGVQPGPARKIRRGEWVRLKMICDLMANESCEDRI